MKKNALVVKSNALIQTSYRLTTNEQRIILACISQVRRDEPVTDQMMYSISAAEFSQTYGVPMGSAYRHLKSAALKLKRREVRITQETNGGGKKKETLIASWVQSIKYSEGTGEVRLRFNHDILPYLSELNRCFTSYRLSNIVRMSSTYGVRIYELLVQWESVGEREVSVDWLRETLQLGEKYKEMSDFKKRVLTPALIDINKNSNLWLKWSQRKTGLKVTHLKFSFGPKEESKKKGAVGPLVFGVPQDVIDKNARPGESNEQAAIRIKKGLHKQKKESTICN